MQHYLLHRGGPLTPNWLNSEVGLSGKRNKKPIVLHMVGSSQGKPGLRYCHDESYPPPEWPPTRQVAPRYSDSGQISSECAVIQTLLPNMTRQTTSRVCRLFGRWQPEGKELGRPRLLDMKEVVTIKRLPPWLAADGLVLGRPGLVSSNSAQTGVGRRLHWFL
jgi:hypothetical protein